MDNLTSLGGGLSIQFNDSLASLTGLDNLTSVGGDLRIHENLTLASLTALGNLTFIEDDLTIQYNSVLTDLTGLENITSVGVHLIVISNANLGGLSGLNNLTSVGADLSISSNANLGSLTGLDNLVSVGGNLSISNDDTLGSLTGLESLVSVGGVLSISNHANLESLTGLDNLISHAGILSISSNANLGSLTGLENLTSVGGGLTISNNPILVSLTGLDNLISLSGSLSISSNANLGSLTGLENLSIIGDDLIILNNTNLASLIALENLSIIGDDLEINENPELSICSYEAICSVLANGNSTIDIYDNGIGCNSEEEVFDGCNYLGRVNHPIFYDLNTNGLFDLGEPYFSTGQVLINPGDIISFGNSVNGGGHYLFFDEYIVSYAELASPNWNLTSALVSDTITLDNLNKRDTIYFGIYPNVDISDLSSVVTSGNFRCNEYVTFDLYTENKGTTTTNGTLWLTVDENVLDVAFIDPPDTLISPNIYGWHFSTLYPGNTAMKQISLQMPGPPDFPLGDNLYFSSEINYTDVNGTHSSGIILYSNEVQCSYDPNDKLVSPVYWPDPL